MRSSAAKGDHPILSKVKAALQEAEEMGGVSDEKEYVQLMAAVIQECATRISDCCNNHEVPHESLSR